MTKQKIGEDGVEFETLSRSTPTLERLAEQKKQVPPAEEYGARVDAISAAAKGHLDSVEAAIKKYSVFTKNGDPKRFATSLEQHLVEDLPEREKDIREYFAREGRDSVQASNVLAQFY